MSKDNESLGSDALFPAGTKRYANSPGIPANAKVQVGDPSPTDVASNAPNLLAPDASKTSAVAKEKLIERICDIFYKQTRGKTVTKEQEAILMWAEQQVVPPLAQAWLEDVEKRETALHREAGEQLLTISETSLEEAHKLAEQYMWEHINRVPAPNNRPATAITDQMVRNIGGVVPLKESKTND